MTKQEAYYIKIYEEVSRIKNRCKSITDAEWFWVIEMAKAYRELTGRNMNKSRCRLPYSLSVYEKILRNRKLIS